MDLATPPLWWATSPILANGGAVEILDISDPATPVSLGQVVLTSVVQGVYVSGSYAYVADGDDALYIIRNVLLTGIAEEEQQLPKTFALEQNYPNPFNPTTTIKYALPSQERVNITIYNALGQKVKTLVDKQQDAGYYTVVWDATNDAGNKVGSGISFYMVKAGKHRSVKKMLLVK